MINLCRSSKSQNTTPDCSPSKIHSFCQKLDTSQVCFQPKDLKIIDLNLDSLPHQRLINWKQNTKSHKSLRRLPNLVIPKGFKRQQSKKLDPTVKLSLECTKKRSEKSLEEKLKQILLKNKNQPLIQKSLSKKEYTLLKPSKMFASKINENNLSLNIGQNQSKKIKSIKQNFQKLPQKQLKVTKANVENWLINRQVKFPKLRTIKVKTQHIQL